MQLENAKARIAPRSAWQAMDLGTRFYRQWASHCTRIWLLFTLVPFLAMTAWMGWQESIWPMVLFWWLKPLWERPLLAFFSHALFAETLSLPALIRQLPRYAFRGLLQQLTWRRLSPSRSFNVCIWQLEGGEESQSRARIRALHSPPSNRSAILTLLLFHLEQAFVIALLLAVFLLVPWQFNLELSDWFLHQDRLHLITFALCWYLVLTLTEPLYVAAGFALYLNKRTWLEGWDLQLGFTRIARHRGVMALLLIAVLWPLDSVTPLQARERSPKAEAIEVLAGDAFMPMEIREERRWIFSDDKGNDWSALWERLFEALEERDSAERTSLDLPDALVRDVAWGLLALLLVWLIRQAMIRAGRYRTGGREKPLPVTHVGSLDIRRQSLPDDIPGALEQALAAQDIRGALALLLRTALADIVPRYPVPLGPGTTEHHCLRQLTQHYGSPAAIASLGRLIDAWTQTAWAHRPVDEQQVRQLWHDWQQQRHAEPDHA